MAHARPGERARRPKAFKLKDHPLCAAIEAWMDDGRSPKLIAEVLARDHPDDKLARVSHETIYRCLYVQTRGGLRADLHKRLSTKRASRNPAGRPTTGAGPTVMERSSRSVIAPRGRRPCGARPLGRRSGRGTQ
jgi:IS30 family transposase